MNDKEYLEKCDGLTFVPDNDGGTEIRFMTFHEKLKGEIETSNSGDTWYHVCFLKYDEENDSFEFDESFDAIFIDPLEYIRGLIGTNVYGTMVKKRQDSSEWFKGYLQNLKDVL
jgi:hypothetical protein